MRTKLNIDRSSLRWSTRLALYQTAADLKQSIDTQQPATGVLNEVLASGQISSVGNKSSLTWSATDAARVHDGYTTAAGKRISGSPWTVLTDFDVVDSFKQSL